MIDSLKIIEYDLNIILKHDDEALDDLINHFLCVFLPFACVDLQLHRVDVHGGRLFRAGSLRPLGVPGLGIGSRLGTAV